MFLHVCMSTCVLTLQHCLTDKISKKGSHFPLEDSLSARSVKRMESMETDYKFKCQLAHGSPQIAISGFTKVAELYSKIVQGFSIPPSEILYCTVNNPLNFMIVLLGDEGERKFVEITKDGPLGITVTDNGAGFSFNKKFQSLCCQ